MRKIAKKPKILSDKIKLSNAIRKEWKTVSIDIGGTGHYWTGLFESPSQSLKLRIYFQLYVRKLGVDYVCMHWMPNNKALTVDDIKTLLYSKQTKLSER